MLMLDQTPLTSTPTCGRNHRNGRAVWTETGGRFPPKSEGGFSRNMQSGWPTEDLKDKIDRFMAYFNETLAKPFQWTMRGKPLTI